MAKAWLVTGCSSGLGRALAQRVLARGDRCVVTARDAASIADIAAPYPDTALADTLDVRDARQRQDVLAKAAARFGALDVLVNNAGHGYSAAVEEGDEAQIRAMFDTNFFGLAALVRDALPAMRARRSGHIVNLSSIGGLIGNMGSGYYNASKFAVEGLSQALALEVAPHGIRVTLIEPGAFRTDFQRRSMVRAKARIGAYADTVGARRAQQDKDIGKEVGDPLRAADAIIRVVDHPDPPLHLVLGATAVSRARQKLTSLLRSIDEWEGVSKSGDFPDTAT
ncbi:MAG: SDR family NAD(P)-dependent oxidoreductase [Burkholderiales bacterium]|nr:SDR family NAD(P)-dependent oxidoreductase [Burkholderiales bacterium]